MEKFMTLDYFGFLFTILSFIFGIWQYFQSKRLKKVISLEAIELHKNIAVALGATQAAKKAVENNQSPNFEIGRAEGICQAILFESAKLYCNLSDTKLDDIDDLISSGRLESNYKHIYYSFSDAKRGCISKALKWIKNR